MRLANQIVHSSPNNIAIPPLNLKRSTDLSKEQKIFDYSLAEMQVEVQKWKLQYEKEKHIRKVVETDREELSIKLTQALRRERSKDEKIASLIQELETIQDTK